MKRRRGARYTPKSAMLEILADDGLSTGQIVATRYRLSHVVGEGGMGVVWAATHLITEKRCALKFLKPTRATDPKSHHRLIHEARAACRVRHPNVAPVHDVLELPNGVPFIVMDLLEGESLAVRLAREGRMSLGKALPVLLSVVDAVVAAHELGIVHRDLKPDNVFLERASHDDAERVRVLDFGIAKLVGSAEPRNSSRPATDSPEPTGASLNATSLTTTMSAVGTPSYMAPEQLEPSLCIGPEADVWALGVLAFECLTGGRPARLGKTGLVSKSEIEAALAERPLPHELRALVGSMLDVAPSARPPIDRVKASLERLARTRARELLPASGQRRTVAKALAVGVLCLSVAGLLVSRTVLSRADERRPPAPAPAAGPAELTTARIEPAAPLGPAPPVSAPSATPAPPSTTSGPAVARPKPTNAPRPPAAARLASPPGEAPPTDLPPPSLAPDDAIPTRVRK
jgi:eukaryotic-like serine/threonine-protein kinase